MLDALEGCRQVWHSKEVDPESLRGKIYLLVVDKLILGALIAAAFVVYDQWKTRETQRYAERIQRVEYIKELVPIVVDSEKDVLVRAQALVALLDTEAIDERSAFALTERLLRAGLTYSDRPRDEDGAYLRSREEHFLMDALLQLMPDALPALLDHYLVSNFPGFMQYEEELDGEDEKNTWRYRKEAPIFWEQLLARAINRHSDSELAILNDDQFLSHYLFALDMAARNPDLRLSDRTPRGLRILYYKRVLERRDAAGLQEEAAQYLLSLASSSTSEHERNVADTIMRFLEELPRDRRRAHAVGEQMRKVLYGGD